MYLGIKSGKLCRAGDRVLPHDAVRTYYADLSFTDGESAIELLNYGFGHTSQSVNSITYLTDI